MEPIRHYYENGSIYHERWLVNGKYHRLDGPAYIVYYKNGSIGSEHWFVNNEYHRLDGPAFMRYNKDGSINHEEWIVHGIEIDENWLEENNIIAPFSEEDLVAIKLRWG